MLSVSKCGYNNVYSDQYAPLYPQEDLAVLKAHEQLITVCGGKHCGALYGIFVCEAACAKTSAKDYYTELMRKADGNDLPLALSLYREVILKLAAVMIKHYDHYVENIWSAERDRITQYIPAVEALFENNRFTERAEAAVGSTLPREFFTATLVTSVENGAEAIDISDEQDVFGIERSPLDAFYFIGHEYIIYLLFEALKEENAFKELNTWNITEGLAEYYLKQVLGDTRFFKPQEKYVLFFEQVNPQMQFNAVALYKKGFKFFSNAR